MGAVMGKGVQLFFTCFELWVVLVCIATMAFFRKEEKEFFNRESEITQQLIE